MASLAGLGVGIEGSAQMTLPQPKIVVPKVGSKSAVAQAASCGSAPRDRRSQVVWRCPQAARASICAMSRSAVLATLEVPVRSMPPGRSS